ncbi:hypothetical protein HT134_17935 [Nonomuraea rhodomycinica]|uniref:Uncharacterized protein n=1 Tax=Nonomuraea rhodomycinica TaxID=1712872 RepID=A0A7Y6IRX1_9ACTN|nr:hypothetical protein [Nonomuraea rhodomycinica]
MRRLIARAAPGGPRPEPRESCELCAAPLDAPHRHLLDLAARELRCACRPCSVLFAEPREAPSAGEGGGGRYRLVPDRRWLLDGFVLDDAMWAELGIPVRMAFLFHDAAAGRTALFYPSPGGPVESPLEPSLWRRLEEANPVLRRLTPDVEALLVNRTGAAAEHWIVPVDDCYRLVGLLRTHWKGLAGGPRVWDAVSGFFTELRQGSATVTPAGQPTHIRGGTR